MDTADEAESAADAEEDPEHPEVVVNPETAGASNPEDANLPEDDVPADADNLVEEDNPTDDGNGVEAANIADDGLSPDAENPDETAETEKPRKAENLVREQPHSGLQSLDESGLGDREEEEIRSDGDDEDRRLNAEEEERRLRGGRGDRRWRRWCPRCCCCCCRYCSARLRPLLVAVAPFRERGRTGRN